MEKTMSRILVETVVKTALKQLKEDPERALRNLVDMAVRFLRGRFQQEFFQAARTLLEKEDSPYYALVRDLFSYADTERMFRFGMNLGYNGCTVGARRIRENEQRLGHPIPWTVLLAWDGGGTARLAQDSAVISEGEALGVYTWMLFARADPEDALGLVRAHPDSAFFLFCEPDALSPCAIDGAAELKNLLPTLRYREERAEEYAALRAQGIPYCVYYPYGQEDCAAICSGDLFVGAQQTGAVFTALVPRRDCPEEVRRQARQAVERARNEQLYQTIPWELEGDNRRVDEIISGDACAVRLDAAGRLLDRMGGPVRPELCVFERGLAGALQLACPKKPAEGRLT